MPIHLADIQDLRTAYNTEKNRPIRVSAGVKVRYEELFEVPAIWLDFIVGGGVFNTFDYMIIGGPDSGKRITLVPWRPKEHLKDAVEKYNGTPEEAEAACGYTSGPAIQYHGSLHVATVAFLQGMLSQEREVLMSTHMTNMYNRLYDERNKD